MLKVTALHTEDHSLIPERRWEWRGIPFGVRVLPSARVHPLCPRRHREGDAYQRSFEGMMF